MCTVLTPRPVTRPQREPGGADAVVHELDHQTPHQLEWRSSVETEYSSQETGNEVSGCGFQLRSSDLIMYETGKLTQQ